MQHICLGCRAIVYCVHCHLVAECHYAVASNAGNCTSGHCVHASWSLCCWSLCFWVIVLLVIVLLDLCAAGHCTAVHCAAGNCTTGHCVHGQCATGAGSYGAGWALGNAWSRWLKILTETKTWKNNYMGMGTAYFVCKWLSYCIFMFLELLALFNH